MTNKRLREQFNKVPLHKGRKVARTYLDNLLKKCRFPWHRTLREEIKREIAFVEEYLR